MAVLGRLLISSAERLDLADFLSQSSYAAGDWKYFMKSLVGEDKPYILKGFDVIDPSTSIGTTAISLKVADSVVYYPGSSAGSFFYGLPEGSDLSLPLVPELRKNATNYIYLTLDTQDTAQDTRSFWDPDKEGGVGGEFTQDVNTESVLKVSVNTSVSAFPQGVIALCKVVVGSNFIESVDDCRDLLFRLGTGGMQSDAHARYSFRDLPSSTYARNEPSSKISNSLSPNPFQGGDKNIYTLKEWMDVVMTKLAELSGTTYWYEDASAFNMVNVFFDTIGSSIKSKGKWIHDSVTPGKVTWTDDLVYESLQDNRNYLIRSGNKTLDDQQILYINFDRNSDVNDFGISIDWFTGVNYVNGSIGAFSNLVKGDWIKKVDDSGSMYIRVEQFYAGTNLSGGITVAASARSVKLNTVYVGTTESKAGIYSRGVYTNTDLVVSTRGDNDLVVAGGNMYWLAYRSDSIQNVQSIVNTSLTIDIFNHNGTTAECRLSSLAPHGLSDGQYIGIIGSTNFDGVYSIEKESDELFYINKSGGPFADELSQTVKFATVTTAARYNNDGTILLESANHGFSSGKKITIASTPNWDAEYTVFVDPAWTTTFTIPVTASIVDYTYVSGTRATATLPVVTVRTELNPVRIEQGESKYIGNIDTDNIHKYIGLTNPSQAIPEYFFNQNSNSKRHTLYTFENYYNDDSVDNLTERAARMTALIADKAQDKTIKFSADYSSLTNTVNGSNQDVVFSKLSGTPTLKVLVPGSDAGVTLTLTGTLSLAVNKVAYFRIDRNAATTIASINGTVQTSSNKFDLDKVLIADIKSVPVDENVFVLAYRLSDSNIWLFNQNKCEIGTIYPIDAISPLIQNTNIVLSIVGGIEFNSSTGTLTWSSDMIMMVPDKSFDFTVTAGSFVGLNDGDVLYVKFDRTGIVPTLVAQSVANGLLSTDVDNYVIGYRRGIDFVLRNGQVVSRVWVYEESMIVSADISAGDEIILPVDSRNGNATKSYKNGRAEIEFFINDACQNRSKLTLTPTFTPNSYNSGTGLISVPDVIDLNLVARENYFKDALNNEYYILGGVNNNLGEKGFFIATGLTPDLTPGASVFKQDYVEFGSSGSWVNSIVSKKVIPTGASLLFRIMPISTLGGGSSSGGGGGGTGSLQDSYNNGRAITITSGNPVEISGPSGEKLLKINGDMFVSGLVDPKGLTLIPQVTNPAPDSSTLWMKTNGNLMFSDSGSDVVISGGGTSPSTGTYTNNTGLVMVAGRVIRKSGATTIAYADWTTFYNAAVCGILLENTLDTNSGQFQRYGRITPGVITATCFTEGSLPSEGSWIYLSDIDGKLTVTPPVQLSGNIQIFIGFWDNGSLNLNITPWGVA
jgi:hypothetical protein